MTETPAASPEPTNADILAFLQDGFAHVMTEIAKTNAKVDALDSKVDAVETGLRNEIRASEARLTNRVNAVQDVVRSVKADLANHVGDPTAHHRHAA